MSAPSLLSLLLVAVVSSSATTISNPFAEGTLHLESPLPLLELSDGYHAGLSPFIVGGAVAALGSRPYQVALLIDERFFCGGSLISEDHIVTAAHCLVTAQEIMVVLGAFNLTATEEDGRQVLLSDSYVIHENYTIDSTKDDIALVKLPKKITFSDTIKAVALPPADMDVGAGTNLTVSGWGKTSDQATTISPVLEEVTVLSITNDDCIKAYSGDLIGPDILCTAGTGGKGACNGDSGGPLTEGSADTLVLRGVVSFGHVGGCTQGAPNGFTRVAHYLDWITKSSIN